LNAEAMQETPHVYSPARGFRPPGTRAQPNSARVNPSQPKSDITESSAFFAGRAR
jgi:hypothetical protein